HIRRDAEIGNVGKGLPERAAFAQTTGRDIVLIRVAALQNIGAVIHHVGDADIEDAVRWGRMHTGHEVAENAITSANEKPLGNALRRYYLIVFLVHDVRRAFIP